MNKQIVQISTFARKVEELIRKHKLLQKDFDEFKRKIAEHPESGDIIQGTGGVRKIRLKSASGGKRGGFRVCYYFHNAEIGEIFLITLYAKNEQEDLTADEKKELKKLVDLIKNR